MKLLWFSKLLTLLVIISIAPVKGVRIDVSVMCQLPSCITLDDALMTLTSNTTLELESGKHYVNQFTLISGLHNINLIGEGGATVACAEGVGLAFVNVSDLSFENIVIDGCGLTGKNLGETVMLLKELVSIFIQIPLDVRVGLFIGHCDNLRMEEVTVTNTSGLGLVGINIIGNSLLKQVDFSLNVRQSDCAVGANIAETSFANTSQRIGGGAYFLYTDFFLPDNYQPTLQIQESNFIENSECSVMGIVERAYFDSQVAQDLGYTIGGGGGLTIMLAQAEYGVEIESDSCLFQNNTAREGAGVHIGIFTGVHNSHVVFSNCTFFRNGFSYEDLAMNFQGIVFTAAAAGMGILNDLIRPNGYEASLFIHNRSVSVSLQNCDFNENGAVTGGGLYIFATYASAIGDIFDVSTFQLDGCTFRNNSAYIGAAIHVTELKLSGRLPGIQVQATDLTVMHNRGITSEFGASFAIADNPSTIDLRYVNFTLRGDSTISFNQATGLASTLALVGVVGNVTFEGNIGVFGGALNLFTFSYLIVTRDSGVHFINNFGRVQGGAIFVSLLGSLGGTTIDDCFLYFGYKDFLFCNNCSNLNEFGMFIEFSGNVAPSGGIIYGSALEFCPWAQPLKEKYPNTSVVDILHTYYPNVFSFDRGPRGAENVITTSTQLVIEDLQPTYFVIPGEKFNVSVAVFDSLQQSISAVLASYNLDTFTDQPGLFLNATPIVGSSGFEFLSGGDPTGVSVRLRASENQSLSIVLYALDSAGRARSAVNIVLGVCPDGFYFNNNTRECECLPELTARGVTCDVANGALIVSNRQWVGPVSNGELAVHRCFIFYCELGTRTISVQNGTVDYDSQCAAGSNRSGILCGSCREGYSITLGSARCRRCSNSYLGLFIVFLGLGILLVVMITYFQITITEGALNGVLFYSNMVTLYAPLLAPANPSGGNFLFAAFLTLNLGIETCFRNGMTPLEKVWWQLSFPIYLFFLMAVIALLARRCKWKQLTGISIIQAFGTLMILCYISILDYSVEILSSETLTVLSGRHTVRWGVDPSVIYFRGVHGFLAILGCFLILLYIIPLPLFLMFPSLAYRAPWLKKFKPYYDSIWNPFKQKYRFWLGFRLIFRWVPFALAYFIQPPRSNFVSGILFSLLLFLQMIIRPFKKEWINILDGFFLFNLVALIMGSLYYSATEDPESRINRSQATAFSTALVVFGYLGFYIVISYHIGKRFPRLKLWFSKCFSACRRGRKTHKVEKVFVQTSQTGETTWEEREDFDGQGTYTQTQSISHSKPQSVTTFSELREPLLELEGTFEIVTLPSPPATN